MFGQSPIGIDQIKSACKFEPTAPDVGKTCVCAAQPARELPEDEGGGCGDAAEIHPR